MYAGEFPPSSHFIELHFGTKMFRRRFNHISSYRSIKMKKAILGILASALLLGGVASVAEAKTNFRLYLGVPYYDQRLGDDYRYYPNRGWYRYQARPNRGNYGRISCNQARNLVRNQGYRNVVARECEGRTYTFSARRNNNRVIVYVNARNGSVSR
jgi:hypothetical protein